MANEIKFDYFHGNESNIQAFIRVPKALITEPAFASLDNDDRMAYAIMLDRVSLSVKNNWIDKQHRVYIRLTMEQVCEELSVGMSKAQKIFKKLGTKVITGIILFFILGSEFFINYRIIPRHRVHAHAAQAEKEEKTA